MRAELRRSIFLACVGLLAGFALVVTLYGAGTFFKQGLGARTGAGSPDGSAVPLTVPPGDGTGKPDRNLQADPPARPGEGGPTPPGKPRAALEGRPDQAQAQAKIPSPGEAPTFDIIRIEPNGEAVIAGRAAPNTTVELLRDNGPIARALVDPSGQFAIVPPALPAGSSEITLRVTGADGQARVSRDSVSVVVAPGRDAKPLIALTSPDKPTIVLSQPDTITAAAPGQAGTGRSETGRSGMAKSDSKQLATNMPGAARPEGPPSRKPPAGPGAEGAKPTAAKREAEEKATPVKIVSVEAEDGGRLYVTSQARPGATVRLYLNDTLVAPGSAGADGRVAFTIGRGVRPGEYKIRVDQVDPVTGQVKTRSEVAFVVPAAVLKPPAKVSEAKAPEAKAPEAKVPDPSGARTAPPDPLAAGPAPGPVARSGSPENPAPLPPAAAPQALAAMPHAGNAAPPATGAAPGGPETAPGIPTVFVPEIGTAKIIRGDSLWQISRRIYGKGTRYTVIYDANQPQIRNPDLIYPGQIFVLPSDGTAAAPQDGSRG